MKNLPRHNRVRGSGLVPLGIVSVLTVVLFGADMLLGGSMRTAVQGVAGSLWASAAQATNAIEASGALASKQALAEENLVLRAQLAALQALAMQNQTLADENAALRLQVGAAPEGSDTHTFAVLSYEDASPYGTFIVGGGSDLDVRSGSLVYAAGGVLVGTIKQVGEHTSQVHALLAPGRVVSVRVGSSTIATLYGRGGGNGIMRIPRDVPVAEHDFVYYEGSSWVVGEVGAIESSAADAEQTLFVRIPLNLYGVRFVSVSL